MPAALPRKAAQWKTGAIIRELEKEIDCINSPEYLRTLAALLEVESLLDNAQLLLAPGADCPANDRIQALELIQQLKAQRIEVRKAMVHVFHPRFGSPFRSSATRSLFFSNLVRNADLYTSDVLNFCNYSLDQHMFFPRRAVYPHEFWFGAHDHSLSHERTGGADGGVVPPADAM